MLYIIYFYFIKSIFPIKVVYLENLSNVYAKLLFIQLIYKQMMELL
jgi:hypothetical protein